MTLQDEVKLADELEASGRELTPEETEYVRVIRETAEAQAAIDNAEKEAKEEEEHKDEDLDRAKPIEPEDNQQPERF
jgi:hypothetical protein